MEAVCRFVLRFYEWTECSLRLRSNIFKFGFECVQYTNLQLVVISLLKSVKLLRLVGVRMKWYQKHSLPFQPRPLNCCKSFLCQKVQFDVVVGILTQILRLGSEPQLKSFSKNNHLNRFSCYV